MRKLALVSAIVGMAALCFSVQAGIYDGIFTNSKTIVLNTKASGAGTSTAVTSFPVLVRLNANNASDVFSGSLTSGGLDIRFSNAAGTTALPYQRERWDATKKVAEFWVLVPTINANDSTQSIKIYWGKSSAVDSSYSNYVFTTANGFKGVFHLAEKDQAGKVNSAYYYNAVTNTAVGYDSIASTDTSGDIGNGHGFTPGKYGGAGDYIATKSVIINNLPQSMWTISLWAKIPSGATYGGAIMSKPGANCGPTEFYFGNQTTGSQQMGLYPQLVSACNNWMMSSTAVTTGTWNHIAYSYGKGASTGKIYINGVSQTLAVNSFGSGSAEPSNSYPTIGGAFSMGGGDTVTFNGNMDEFRMDTTVRSDDWIKLCYKNQLSTGTSDSLTVIPPVSLTYATNPLSLVATVVITPDMAILVASPCTYSATGLPGGLSINSSTGMISGTPSASGSGTITVTASNAAGIASCTIPYSIDGPRAPDVPVLSYPADLRVDFPLSDTLKWGAATGAVTYRVQVSTATDFSTLVLDDSTVSGTSRATGLLPANTTYYWRVNATNGVGTGNWSAYRTFATVPSTPSLTTPTAGATAQSVNPVLTWTTVNGASLYHAQVSTISTFASLVAEDSTLASATKQLFALNANSVYYWRVCAKNAAGVSGAYAAPLSFTTIATPSLSLPANAATSQLITPTLTWGAITGAATYHLTVSTLSGFSSGVLDYPGLTSTSKQLTGLPYNTTYYWKVQAINSSNDTGYTSAARSFTTRGVPEDYSGYVSSKKIVLNTTSTGAGITSDVSNFVALIRLTGSNAPDIFSGSNNNGLDIRFTDASNNHLAFQRERWDATNQRAEFWVRMPTITANSTAQSINILWNKAGAADSSNGTWTFDTAAGYQGVWHMNGAVGVGDSDATVNKYFATAQGSPVDTSGMVGRGKWFNHSSMYDTIIGSVSSKLNFLPGSNYTLSAWICPDTFPGPGSADSSYYAIISKGNKQYALALGDSTSGATRSGKPEMVEYRSTWSNIQPIAVLKAKQWVHVAGRVASSGSYDTVTAYVNGATLGSPAIATGTSGQVTTGDVCIGRQSSVTGNTTASPYREFWGKIDELQMANVARSPDWIKLSYKNQLVNGTSDSLTVLPPLSLTYATNPLSLVASVAITPDVATFTGGPCPYSATGLPAGLSINSSTGMISGTPLVSGAGTIAVTVTNAAGSISCSVPYTIAAPPAPSVPVLSYPADLRTDFPLSDTLKWSATTGAVTYRVQVSTATDFSTLVLDDSTVSATNRATGSLLPNTTYYWQVNAKNELSTSNWSAYRTFTTVPAAPVLTTPTTGATAQSVNPVLTWTTVGGATLYHAQVSTISTFASLVAEDSTLASATKQLFALNANSVYYWRVCAKNATGASGVYAAPLSFTTIATPSLSLPANAATNQLIAPTLTWGSITGAATYHLTVSTLSNFSSGVLDYPGLVSTSRQLTGLAYSTPYYWRVQAINSNNDTGYTSAARSFTTRGAPETYAYSSTKKIVLNTKASGASITTAVSNFPVLVRLNASNANDVFTGSLTTGGLDIRFTDASGNHLAFQRERWDATNKLAEFWVRVGTINGSDSVQSINLLYGQSNAADSSNGAWVFDTAVGFAAVYHFAEGGGKALGSTILDATGYHNGLDSMATTTTGTTGMAGLGHQFVSGDHINLGGWAPTTNHQLTLSAWVLNNTGNANATIISQRASWSASANHWDFFARPNSTTGWYPQVYNGTNSTNFGSPVSINQGVWNYAAVTMDSAGTAAQAYSNGGTNGTAIAQAWGTGSTTYQIIIGRTGDPSETFIGYMDEVRIEKTIRSADWIKLSYKNQLSTGTADSLTILSPTSLVYATSPLSAVATVAITPDVATLVGSPCTYSATGLPAGLSINSSTGAISGTSLVSGSGSITVTASNAAGSVNCNVPYTIAVPPAAGVPVLSYPADLRTDFPVSDTLKWGATTGAATYRVQVSTATDFSALVLDDSTVTATNRATGLLPGNTTYFWRVNAKNETSTGGWSAYRTFTTVPSTPILTTPTAGATAQSVNPVLTWTAVNGATLYHAQVSTISTFASLVAEDSTLTSATKQLFALNANSVYYWRVSAKNAAGISGAYAAPLSFATIATPSLSSPANTATSQLLTPTLTWGSVTGAATYHVQVATISDFSSIANDFPGVTAASQQLTGLPYNTTYFWKVQALNASGDTGYTSASRSFTTRGVPEDYSGYASTKKIVLNTTSTGAGTTSDVSNFVALVRLTGSNAPDVFSGSKNNGLDIRFTDASNNHLGFQRERWDATNKRAEFWVKMPTITANSTAQSINILWNKTGAADSSNGTWAFDTAAGYQGVWHMNGAVGSGDSDATFNKYFATAQGSPADSNGMVGRGKWFNHSSMYDTIIGSASGKLNFLAGSNYTLSAWVCPDSFPVASYFDSSYYAIVSKGNAQYAFSINGSVTGSTRTGLPEMMEYRSTWANTQPITMPTAKVWTHLAGRVASSGSYDTVTIFVNGATLATLGSPAIASGTSAQVTTGDVCIGRQPSVTNNTLGSPNRMFWGKMDEVQMANVARSPDWIKMSYKNQCAADSLMAIAPTSLIYASSSITGAVGTAIVADTAALTGSWCTFTATGLPAGLAIGSTTGTILGTPTAGTSTVVAHVTATNAAGSISADVSISITVGVPVLTTPVTGATDVTINPTLTWSTVDGATLYQAQVSTASSFDATVVNDSTLTVGIKTLSTALTDNAQYFWRVRAINGAGPSAWSAVSNFTTIAVVAPSAVTLTAPTTGARGVALLPTLTWGTVSGATLYQAQVSTVSAFATTLVNDSTLTRGTKTLSTALADNTQYFWRVRAVNVGGTSAWATDSFTTVKQNLLALTAGWSIVSFNVTPTDSQATTIFGSMSHLVIAKNNNGGVFVPAYSANSIGSVRTGEAYQIYVSADDTIRVAGAPINPATTPIALGTGWSMLGYLPQVDMPITTALAGITSQIVIVKNTDGNVYSPDYGANSIGTMHPGEGYVIYMKSDVALTYPTGLSKTLLASSGTITPKNKHYVCAKLRSDNSATVLLKRVVENAKVVPDSTEIAAYDANGTLVGSGVVMHGSAAFTVWGDNSMTKEKDGLTAKESMTFKIWLPFGEEYTANYVGTNSDGYAAQAIMQGNMSVQHTLKITQCALASVSPNPFRGNVRIGFDVATVNGKDMQNVEINVYDVRGVLVRQLAKGLYKTGRYSVMWDGSDHIGSNMYIVTMKTDNFSQKMKLFKVK